MSGTVRIGVVGATGIGGTHRNAIKQVGGAKLTAVCDVVPEFVEQVSKEEKVEGFTDPVKMYKSGLVDAVCICTPHWFHPELTEQAFRNGLHVLVEKPMAVTVSGCDRMITASKKANRVLQVVYQRRYMPHNIKFHDMVRKGVLGRILRVEMACSMFRSQAYYDSGAWRGTWAGEGGGVLLNQGPHPIDAMLFVSCLDPVRLLAVNGTQLHRMETEDRCDAMMWYKNGAVGFFHVCTNEWPGTEKIEVVGTGGKLLAEGGKLTFWQNKIPVDKFIKTATEKWAHPADAVMKDVTPKPGKKRMSHYALMKDFVDSIAKRRKPAVTGEEGMRSVEVMNAAILSSFTGKPVELPVNRRAYDALMKKLCAASKFKPAAKKKAKKKRK